MRAGRTAGISFLAPVLALLVAGRVLGAGEIAPGSYCKLPKPGEKPACLEPARAQYGDFIRGVERGDLDDREAARLERDVAAGAGGENPYLALSSLSYGYFRLAQEAAQGTGDVSVRIRLVR